MIVNYVRKASEKYLMVLKEESEKGRGRRTSGGEVKEKSRRSGGKARKREKNTSEGKMNERTSGSKLYERTSKRISFLCV